MPVIERALPSDAGEIEALLKSSGLPLEGVREHLPRFYVARESGALAGVIGIESYGTEGLLRSLAVRPSSRSRGIGSSLYLRLIADARSSGIRRLVLLTTTAEGWFAGRGFVPVDRETVTGAMRTSAEFTGACPDSAVCMELELQ
ncbi:MAG TPA: arsenic resistance N-acetyltransferase ArsN2 [Bacteroidota bacterium]|nr:arsenic resistance N-acetyltransferase ArsN2 [Bacteroidota bacterium]